MAGRIKGLLGAPPTGRTTRRRLHKGGGGLASASSLNRSGIDEIVVTDTAVSLQKLDSLLRELPIADGARVGAIRAQIKSGRYPIDDIRVAEKLLTFEVLYHGASIHARTYAFA